MVEPRSERAQADLDVAQAFAARQLGEGHAQKLIHAGEAAMTPLAPVAADAAMKFVSGKVVHHLGEDGAARVHAPLSATEPLAGSATAAIRIENAANRP
jgi:hypothetical protein